MRTFLAIGGVVVGGAIALAAGCKSKSDDAPADAGIAATPEMIARGEYLVKTIAGCGECHTPRDASGNLDMSKWLGGVPNRFDLVPDDDTRGAIGAPNITPHGIGAWTDAQVRAAIVDGRAADGEVLFPLMPYYVFHNMTSDDANAIVAYLRTVPEVATDIPDRQPLPVKYTVPAEAVPEAAIPHTTLKPTDKGFARAEHGRYLAGEIGLCMDCHTRWNLGLPQPLSLDALFAGGRAFSAHEWTVPAPAPSVLYSYNVTPDERGIKDWTPQTVGAAIKFGTDDQGAILCRPMPVFGAMTDDDAYDIGMYLSTLPPIASAAVPECTVSNEDAGADAGEDASGDAGSEAGLDAASDAGNAGDAGDASDLDAGDALPE